MELLDLVRYGLFCSTIIMKVIGVPTCITMIKTKETKYFPMEFFFMQALAAFNMGVFGYMINDDLATYLNVFGLVMNIGYFIIYVALEKNLGRFYKFLSAFVSFIVIVYSFVFLVADPSKRRNLMGVVSSGTVSFLFIPGIIMIVRTVRTKEYKNIDMNIVAGGTFATCMWFLYGVLRGEYFIAAPYVVGIIMNTAFILCRLHYASQKKEVNKKED